MTSLTDPSPRRARSGAILRSSGPTPRRGAIDPCSTWYSPRKPDFSMAIRLCGSSTTHTWLLSRSASAQIRQGSVSVMLKQREQRRRVSLTSRRAVARARASSRLLRRRWKASRWADLAPMPGSLRNASISRSSGAASRITSQPGDAEGADLLGHRLLDLAPGLVDRDPDQVLEHLHVLRLDDLGRDAHGEELVGAAHGHAHHAATGRGLDLHLGDLLLQLLLHLLRLLHQRLDVHVSSSCALRPGRRPRSGRRRRRGARARWAPSRPPPAGAVWPSRPSRRARHCGSRRRRASRRSP